MRLFVCLLASRKAYLYLSKAIEIKSIGSNVGQIDVSSEQQQKWSHPPANQPVTNNKNNNTSCIVYDKSIVKGQILLSSFTNLFSRLDSKRSLVILVIQFQRVD